MKNVDDRLDKEQVDKLTKISGASREEIIQLVEIFSKVVVDVWKGIKRELVELGFCIQENNREQNVKFYRKKKSQRKNWKKWKKRL